MAQGKNDSYLQNKSKKNVPMLVSQSEKGVRNDGVSQVRIPNSLNWSCVDKHHFTFNLLCFSVPYTPSSTRHILRHLPGMYAAIYQACTPASIRHVQRHLLSMYLGSLALISPELNSLFRTQTALNTISISIRLTKETPLFRINQTDNTGGRESEDSGIPDQRRSGESGERLYLSSFFYRETGQAG